MWAVKARYSLESHHWRFPAVEAKGKFHRGSFSAGGDTPIARSAVIFPKVCESARTRRSFAAMMKHSAVVAFLVGHFFATPAFARRAPDITVAPTGWGQATAAEVRAVFISAAGEIWKHCPDTRVGGIVVVHRNDHPQTEWERGAGGRIVIGIEARDRRVAQLAFQFAHEFCHALAAHSNDWRRTWREEGKPNHWLEESLCGTASLFALRAMARSWQTAAPDREWTSYAPEFSKYAQESMGESARLPRGVTFPEWLRRNETAMRGNPNLRAKNAMVAAQLLPLFEDDPRGWEAVTFMNLGEHDRKMPLPRFLAEWQRNCPPKLQGFVAKVALVFDVRL